MSAEPLAEASLEALLEFLRDARGFDFTGYKRTTLVRRIAKRMEAVDVGSYEDYIDLLEVQPDEFAALFDTVLINVTGFFRDPLTWELMRDEVIGALLASIPPGDPIRVWCAGCASGEETFTLAILLCEALGTVEFLQRVKIYATDVDQDALKEARAAIYPAKALESVPPELAERYFERLDQRFAFRKDLRRVVVFGRNDLVQDAPISRIDLLTCRNTLMYFNAETQARIIKRLHFALEDRGVLLLGKSEMLTSQAGLLRPIDLKRRIFAKVPRTGRRVPGAAGPVAAGGGVSSSARGEAFEVAPIGQLVVDAGGILVAANGRARRDLRVDAADLGRPLQDLEISYRPVELRSHLTRVTSERRSLTLPPTTLQLASGERRQVEVHLAPLPGAEAGGVAVFFSDVTEQRRLLAEVEASRVELASAYEELQSTVEELETTNEELQSTNEELETTNEELQSTNEELETMNEELQSTNEELATVNDELRIRSVQLDDVNGFLETILSTMGVAVAVLDRMQVVQLWNGQAEELWGLRADEVIGRNLLTLDIGLPVRDLVEPVREAIVRGADPAELTLDAVNRRGRTIACRLTVLPLRTGDEVTGAVLLMNDSAVSPTADHDGPVPA